METKTTGMRKRGRPKKKEYDPENIMQELIDTVTEVYREKRWRR